MALKDLVTAAFGTSTAALGTSTSTLPLSSVDEHPDWLRHQQQQDDLATKLAATTNDLSRLERERVQAEHDVREADVLRLLRDNVAAKAPDAVAADEAIATALSRVAAIAEALRRLDQRGADLRNEIVWQMLPAIEAAARERVKKLWETLRAASAINAELAELERTFERYDLIEAPVRSWQELHLYENRRLYLWLGSAQASGWEI
jgi:transcriptional regulator